MTQYIIILALVAVSAVTLFSAFGGVNRAQVSAVANEIAGNGQGAKDSIQLAQNYAKYASDSASYSRNMGNYNSSPNWSNYSGGGGSGSGGSGSGGSGSGGSGSGGSGSGGSGSGGSGSGGSGSGGSGSGGTGTGSSGTGSSGTGGTGTGGSGTGGSGTGGSGTGVASCTSGDSNGYSIVAKPTKIDGSTGEICTTQSKVYKKYKQIKYSVYLGGEYNSKTTGYSTVVTNGKGGLKIAIADGTDIEIIRLTATKIHEESHRQDMLKNSLNITSTLKGAKANLTILMDEKAQFISEVNASVDELKYLNKQLALAKKANRANAVIIIEGYIKSAQEYYKKYEAKIK